jgi:hypothetical protein
LSILTLSLTKWFDSIRKPLDFYETWANKDDARERRYFYNVDFQGRLFLEEVSPKNIATSIKDEYVDIVSGDCCLGSSVSYHIISLMRHFFVIEPENF